MTSKQYQCFHCNVNHSQGFQCVVRTLPVFPEWYHKSHKCHLFLLLRWDDEWRPVTKTPPQADVRGQGHSWGQCSGGGCFCHKKQEHIFLNLNINNIKVFVHWGSNIKTTLRMFFRVCVISAERSLICSVKPDGRFGHNKNSCWSEADMFIGNIQNTDQLSAWQKHRSWRRAAPSSSSSSACVCVFAPRCSSGSFSSGLSLTEGKFLPLLTGKLVLFRDVFVAQTRWSLADIFKKVSFFNF